MVCGGRRFPGVVFWRDIAYAASCFHILVESNPPIDTYVLPIYLHLKFTTAATFRDGGFPFSQ